MDGRKFLHIFSRRSLLCMCEPKEARRRAGGSLLFLHFLHCNVFYVRGVATAALSSLMFAVFLLRHRITADVSTLCFVSLYPFIVVRIIPHSAMTCVASGLGCIELLDGAAVSSEKDLRVGILS